MNAACEPRRSIVRYGVVTPNMRLAVTGAEGYNGILWKPYRYNGTGEDTLTAWMDAEPAKRNAGTGRILKPCGTTAAAQRHYRRKEPLDEACLEAMRLDWQHSGERRERNNARRRNANAAQRKAAA